MLNRLFNKKTQLETKQEYKSLLDEKKSEGSLFDSQKIPTNENELNVYIQFSHALIAGIEKRALLLEPTLELLGYKQSLKQYGRHFCMMVANTVLDPKSKLAEFSDLITSELAYMLYNHHARKTNEKLSYSEYIERCHHFLNAARELDVAPELLDIRTNCYELRQTIANNQFKLDEYAKHKYSKELNHLIERIEAREFIKSKYLPPAESVFRLG